MGPQETPSRQRLSLAVLLLDVLGQPDTRDCRIRRFPSTHDPRVSFVHRLDELRSHLLFIPCRLYHIRCSFLTQKYKHTAVPAKAARHVQTVDRTGLVPVQ